MSISNSAISLTLRTVDKLTHRIVDATSKTCYANDDYFVFVTITMNMDAIGNVPNNIKFKVYSDLADSTAICLKRCNNSRDILSGNLACFEYSTASLGMKNEIDVTGFILNGKQYIQYFCIDIVEPNTECKIYNEKSTFRLRPDVTFDTDNFDDSIFLKPKNSKMLSMNLGNNAIGINLRNGSFQHKYLLANYKCEKYENPFFLSYSPMHCDSNEINGLETGLPYGFITNFHQHIIDNSTYLTFVDENYHSRNFYPSQNEDNVFIDETNRRLIIERDNNYTYKLIDSHFNILEFDENGLLVKLKTRKGNSYSEIYIEYYYGTAKIYRIFNDNEIDIQFFYIGMNNVISILFNNYKDNILIKYDDSMLLEYIQEYDDTTDFSYQTLNINSQSYNVLNNIRIRNKNINIQYDEFGRVNTIDEQSVNSDLSINTNNHVELQFEKLATIVTKTQFSNTNLVTKKKYFYDGTNECISECYIENDAFKSPVFYLNNQNISESLSKPKHNIDSISDLYLMDVEISRQFNCSFTAHNMYCLFFSLKYVREYTHICTDPVEIKIFEGDNCIARRTLTKDEILTKVPVYLTFVTEYDHDDFDTSRVRVTFSKNGVYGKVEISDVKLTMSSLQRSSYLGSNICFGELIDSYNGVTYYSFSNGIYLKYKLQGGSTYIFATIPDISYEDLLFTLIFNKAFSKQYFFYANGEEFYSNLVDFKISNSQFSNWFNIDELELAIISKTETDDISKYKEFTLFKDNGYNFVNKKITIHQYGTNNIAAEECQNISYDLLPISKVGINNKSVIYNYNNDCLINQEIVYVEDGNKIIKDYEYSDNFDLSEETCYLNYNSIIHSNVFNYHLLTESKDSEFDSTYFEYDINRNHTRTYNQNSSDINVCYVEDSAIPEFIYDGNYSQINSNIKFYYDEDERIIRIDLFGVSNEYFEYGNSGNYYSKKSTSYNSFEINEFYDKYGRLIRKEESDGDFIEYWYSSAYSPDLFNQSIENNLYKIRYGNGDNYVDEIYLYDDFDRVETKHDNVFRVNYSYNAQMDQHTYFDCVRKEYETMNPSASVSNPLWVETEISCLTYPLNHPQKFKEIIITDGTINYENTFEHSVDKCSANNVTEQFYIKNTQELSNSKTFKRRFECYPDYSSGIQNAVTSFVHYDRYYKNISQGEELILKNEYEYDDSGLLSLIRMECSNNYITSNFVYDEKARLIQDQSIFGIKQYTYDDYGNITSKIINHYVSETYSYNSKKQLISWNGLSFAYDNGGFPTIYKGINVLFQNKNLVQFGTFNLKYDAFKRITEIRNNGNLTSSFTYFDSKLINFRRTINNTYYVLRFVYGADDKIAGFICNGMFYYYARNILNDVVAIYDQHQVLICTYGYDAYGNHKVFNPDGTENTSPSFVGNLNPIKYRGYIYVAETSLYYIASRYYDPEISRFISPDSVDYLNPTTINGLNLYAYCGNDPVNYYDPSGHFAISSFLIGLGIATLIGAAVGAFSYTASEGLSYAITGEFTWSWAQFVGSVIGGAIGGAFSMIPGIGTMAVAGITGALSTGIGMVLQNEFEDTNYSIGQILFTSSINGLISAFASGIFEAIPIKGLNRGRGSYEAICKQINTKFFNGTIKHISYNTFSKMLTYNMIGSLIDTGYSGIIDVCNGNDWLSNLFYQE